MEAEDLRDAIVLIRETNENREHGIFSASTKRLQQAAGPVGVYTVK